MNSKKIIGLWLLLLIPLSVMAKDENVSYVVSKVSGRVEVVTSRGKRKVEKGDVLTADAVVHDLVDRERQQTICYQCPRQS